MHKGIEALEKEMLSQDSFIILHEGETRIYGLK